MNIDIFGPNLRSQWTIELFTDFTVSNVSNLVFYVCGVDHFEPFEPYYAIRLACIDRSTRCAVYETPWSDRRLPQILGLWGQPRDLLLLTLPVGSLVKLCTIEVSIMMNYASLKGQSCY